MGPGVAVAQRPAADPEGAVGSTVVRKALVEESGVPVAPAGRVQARVGARYRAHFPFRSDGRVSIRYAVRKLAIVQTPQKKKKPMA